ncbi:MAG: RNA polymerase sigma factor [Candidatus Aminicenantes bacterium]|nr:RNA polymerase sigma factor [Candidatus Aminicenantes bacterium]
MNIQMADDEDVFEKLIAPVERQMMRTIWRVVRHDQMAEDTLQETLAVIWEKRNRVRKHPNPRALILKICLDCAYDALRKKKRQNRLQGEVKSAAAGVLTRNDASHNLEKKHVESEILRSIGRLSRNQAVAVLMRIVQEQSYETIAEVMGCSQATARIHVLRGRKRLSRWLAPLYYSSYEESKNG